MTQFIKVGGLSIITAVFGIFVFILVQILPLFRGAEVHERRTVQIPAGDYRAFGVDEWGELPFVITADGTIYFVDLKGNAAPQNVDPGFAEQKTISAFQYDPTRQKIIFGTSDGHFSIAEIGYGTTFDGKNRKVIQALKAGPFFPVGQPGFPVREIRFADSDQNKLIAVLQDVDGKTRVYTETLEQTQSLMGAGEIVVGKPFDLTSQIDGEPAILSVNMAASDIVVANRKGEVFYFAFSGGDLRLIQRFQPFQDLQDPAISSMDYLFGGVSLVFAARDGTNRVFSLYTEEGGDIRKFGKTKEFASLPGPATFFAPSVRNKAFLTGSGSFASLRFSTTEDIRWEQNLPFRISQAAIGGKFNSLYFLDTQNKLHIYQLKDPHPESSLKALFGKIWYEGARKPDYVWQSTGGTDDFEPKLSLVPLIIGTLKGTLYAMLFALPIALLAATYTSQFLHPNFRIIVKPIMEIMASLPSVVLGFLAALWLAPILEERVPSVIVMLVLIPLSALLFGWLWSRLPIQYRVLIKPGYEWIFFLPVLVIASVLSWQLGPVLEKALFVTQDPSTGKLVADFRLWWPHATGLPFEQRNSLIVGFMMGFAVIPIIFTIAEDAMSNVPQALRSGSLALGASRWQTAVRIILPTASAGIFSAIMIGLGRAVGETMIVVMATGNTPILDFNIFSGMRTLSANIAVELPGSPCPGHSVPNSFSGWNGAFLDDIYGEHLRRNPETTSSREVQNGMSTENKTSAAKTKAVGEPFVWFTSMGLTIGLVMVIYLLGLIIANGVKVFWPSRIARIQLREGSSAAINGSSFLGGAIIHEQKKITKALEGTPGEVEWQLFMGNKDQYGLSFKFVDHKDVADVQYPPGIISVERMEYGDAIGFPKSIQTRGKGAIFANDPKFRAQLESMVREGAKRRAEIKKVEKGQIGRINHEMEELQLQEKLIRKDNTASSQEAALKTIHARISVLQGEYDVLAKRAQELRAKQSEDTFAYSLITGEEKSIAMGQIVSYSFPNAMNFWQRLGFFFHRLWIFVSDEPREANTEGGIFPAIFGTFVMTLLLSVAVTPFGVLAAIYLREYARQGLFVRSVRIAVNNLAGVPSIVFGVFGLGFFVYLVGGTIDRFFFSEYLPTPTFGTGGILWASLTLALMTVPVVIVATEESLAAVPRGVREGSLACGASKWQTILRVVLPASAPGILTGLILAMARGAGEVAPLMLVGVVKLAPSLPLDGAYPFLHLDQKFMHLGFHIYDLGFQSPDSEAAKPMVFATTFFLILLVVLLNLGAIVIRERLRRKYSTGAF